MRLKRFGSLSEKVNKITVNKDEKCPVCGMFVAKYPKWAASIATQNHKKPFYFDGVKDMMKFYFNAKDYGHKDFDKNKAKITVSDYYTREEINARKAFYVIGSNIYGPMGNELIPFRTKKDAKIFLTPGGSTPNIWVDSNSRTRDTSIHK